MSEQNNHLPQKAELITKELVKSVFSLEMAAANYQKFLQEAENITFTRENLKSDHTALKKLREILAALDNSREVKKKPFTAAGKAIQDAYNDLAKPIDDILKRKTEEFRIVNEKIKAENDEIDRINRRNAEVKNAIQYFVNHTTIAITNAQTDTEIVRIQKAIGTEKSRGGYYGSFIDELKTSCDNLTPLINERKDAIRRLNDLKAKEKVVDDQFKLVEIKEEQERIQIEMDENSIRIKERAFEQAVAIETPVVESMAEVVVPRRKTWQFRVEDFTALYKKMPELVTMVPNKAAIKAFIDAKKEDGSLDAVEELKFPGITLYLEKLY